ncbi:hypothetical protein QW131_10130 [Roseibium salinum]|nr:hypothetical protein [Roseibium salinum]
MLYCSISMQLFFGEPSWPFLWLTAQKTDAPSAFMDAFREAKGDLTDVINEAAGLKDEGDDDAMFHRLKYLRRIDKMLTASEVRDFMVPSDVSDHWELPEPLPTPVKAWHQDKAREELQQRLARIGIHVGG